MDHAATTPPDPRVVAEMLPYLTSAWGNPSGIHAEAREARRGLDAARHAVAGVLGAKPNEIIFTSGGSESDNLALRAVATASRRRGDHIITSAIEHHAVLRECEALEREGTARGIRHFRLSAQLTARAFYERHGYTAVGEVYDEVGIPHIAMERRV